MVVTNQRTIKIVVNNKKKLKRRENMWKIERQHLERQEKKTGVTQLD